MVRQMMGRPPKPKPAPPPPLSQVLQSTVEQQRLSLPKGVDLTSEIAAGLEPIRCSQTDVERLVENLIRNAVEAMPRGGRVVVTAHHLELAGPYPVQFPQTALPAGQYPRISVGDSGCGIAPEALDRIFEEGFSTKGGQNCGLGLANVADIVVRHHGGIRVESIVGKGTRFDVFLPVVDPTG